MTGATLAKITARWLALLSACACWAAPGKLSILVEEYPPFVTEQNGWPSGPYVDTLSKLAKDHNIPVSIELMPIRRSLYVAQHTANTCVLGLGYSAADAEVLLYLGRIAPIYIWAYARHGDKFTASNLADLRRYSVATVDMAEVRRLLDDSGVHYDTLQFSGRALQMLQAHRFDVLVSDIGPELAATREGVSLDRLFTVTRVDRWLACNPGSDPTNLGALRLALKEGLFSQDASGFWEKYGLGNYYTQVRKDWSAIAKP